MATVFAPYGLKPINLIGGQAFNGGGVREYKLTVNNTDPIFNGDLVQIVGGVPTVISATPVAGTTKGIVGVCSGVRYQLAGQQLGYPLWSQYLPANAVTAGYTNIFIRVVEDPDQLYQVQASGIVTAASIGLNAALENFTAGTGGTTGNTVSGNSVVSLDDASIADTATLAVRIVDLVNEPSTFGGNYPSNPGDAFTDVIVKLNFGVHSYQLAVGSA
jgi:hypothetical protein